MQRGARPRLGLFTRSSCVKLVESVDNWATESFDQRVTEGRGGSGRKEEGGYTSGAQDYSREYKRRMRWDVIQPLDLSSDSDTPEGA